MNNAPVAGFERDAGSRTTVRLMYPEGAPRSANEYRGTAVVALAVFKSLDLDWLTSVVTRRPLVRRPHRRRRGRGSVSGLTRRCRRQGFWSKLWFWREVVDEIPLKPGSFRILHPEIIHRTGQVLQRYTLTQGNVSFRSAWGGGGKKSGKDDANATPDPQMVPTLGASAVVMALQVCDQVSLAGFGYDMHHPQSRLHYYETIPMGAMEAQVGQLSLKRPLTTSHHPSRVAPPRLVSRQVVHDIGAEKLFLRDLVASGSVTDLTGAL